ncbi:MAG TPA: UDP-N-acetylmuramoyl-tripeptide--D-alanyl-D-alanine ligase [bacterium]|nr:UDP-N-acetylmuramoyl-tripeptide--D-alanyl-D-alanine ligase [bacterium]
MERSGQPIRVPKPSAAGASAAMVETDFPAPPGLDLPLLRADGTARALGALARGYRKTLEITACAVTGSNGKTTTKTLLGSLLGSVMPTAVAPASYNNLIGVSLSVLAVEGGDRAAVFELGMNRSGEIAALAAISLPEIGVITNIGAAHLGMLGSMEAVAAAKGELLPALEGRRAAVVNRDDHRAWALLERFRGEAVGFGAAPEADLRVRGWEQTGESARAALTWRDRAAVVELPFPGRHNLYNYLGALAAALTAGVPWESALEATPGLRLPAMRFQRVSCRGVELINDAYNANPDSMRAALAAWLLLPRSGRRILVSGDMAELGEHTVREHRLWGEAAAGAGLDALVFVGPESAAAADAAAAAGAAEVMRFPDPVEAGAVLAGYVREGDSLLFKWSRRAGMERAIEEIRKNAEGSPGG